MRFATGYRPDPSGYPRTSFRHLAAKLGALALPDAASIFDRAPPVMDQASSASCTGHAVSCGIYTALELDWVPSPAEIYRNGRAIDRVPHFDGSFDPLTDDGAMPNQVLRAVNEFGIRPMVSLATRFSDADPRTINNEPKLGDLEIEALNVIVGDYGIYSAGQQRIEDLCTSIAHGKPVCVAIAGGSNRFQGYSGGVLPALMAPLDHYVVLLSYETAPSGERIFGGRNSWTDSWGEDGNFRLSEAAVEELGDIIALNVRRAA